MTHIVKTVTNVKLQPACWKEKKLMKKLLALLLLLTITQANIADELYDLVKDDLTHIVCNASGEQS